jgi:hypothetical protein
LAAIATPEIDGDDLAASGTLHGVQNPGKRLELPLLDALPRGSLVELDGAPARIVAALRLRVIVTTASPGRGPRTAVASGVARAASTAAARAVAVRTASAGAISS